MKYLLDTNIISEVRKGTRCDPKVAAWYSSIDEGSIFLSVLVLGEIRRGLERARSTDPAQARALETWLAAVRKSFAGRILPVDEDVSEEWGRMSSGRAVPVIDALLAATAKLNRMTLATRNVSDVRGLGAEVLNPFEHSPR